jgi:uncharacterized protein (TIGR03435 family)
MRAPVWVGSTAALLTIGLELQAQDRPRFDVAAIRENRDVEPGGFVRFMPDGGIRAVHTTPAGLIAVAFQLDRWQVSGAPAWSEHVSYDIEAKPQAPVLRPQTYLMMQRLLEERFALQTHREQREADAFALVRVRPDRLGEGLKESATDCTVLPLSPDCPLNRPVPGEYRTVGLPLAMLVGRLQSQLRAPVADETQLAGLHDITLVWTNDPAIPSDRPSLATALQEQLGLRLERRRILSHVLIVERLQRPTPN